MKFLKAALRLARRALLFVLILYWAALLWGSIGALVSGGPARLSVWYRHIAEGPLIGDCVADTCTFTYSAFDPRRQGWVGFAAAQLLYLTITLLLVFFEWRFQRKKRQTERN